MSVTYTEKVTITRERSKRVSSGRSGQKAIGGGQKPHRRGWHKIIYGRFVSKSKYFEILEQWDCWEGYTDSYRALMAADYCEVSEAFVRAVVRDRENYRSRKRALTQ